MAETTDDEHPRYILRPDVTMSDEEAERIKERFLAAQDRPAIFLPVKTPRRPSWRERLGRKVGSWIAGVDPTEQEDWR